MTAWLLLSVGEDRQHGGNDGYDDQPDSYYSWDSTVPNHAALALGDIVVLWDKKASLGISVVEEILEPVFEEKVRHRCPNCHRANIKTRRKADSTEKFRCYTCKSVFAEPESRFDHVTRYRERHDAGWVPLNEVFSGAELRSMATSPKSQLSIRQLDWEAMQSVLSQKGMANLVAHISGRAGLSTGRGHVRVCTRARLGQTEFRRRLLDRYGAVCAITGIQPSEVLEAAHLYSYARIGQHHDHGGLLLRRDVHSLFDRGALAVDPKNLSISLSGHLRTFASYRDLEGQTLVASVTPEQRRWLAAHWTQHRESH